MIYLIYHGYFSFTLHQVVADLSKKSTNVLPKPHTDYILEYRDGDIVATDLKGDPTPEAILFFDKDIRLARALSKIAPVLNAPEAIALADDKIKTWEVLASRVPMIETIPGPFHYRRSAPKREYIAFLESRFGYPMVLKAAKGSFGEQVFLVDDRNALIQRIESFEDADFLAQRFISESSGIDTRVLIVGDEILGAIERRNDFDFRANIESGGSAHPVELTDTEKSIALAAHRALNLDFSGIDLIDSKDGPLVIEVNSNASYLGFQEATGIDVSRHLLNHIEGILRS